MYLFLYREEVHIQLQMEGKIALVWRDKNVLKKENPDGHLITQIKKHGLVAPSQNHVDYLKVQYIYIRTVRLHCKCLHGFTGYP